MELSVKQFIGIVQFLLPVILKTDSTILEIPNSVSQTSGTTVITLYTDKRTWKEARQICRNAGGYLINLETAEKRTELQNLKTNQFSSGYDKPWVGLYYTELQKMYWDGPGCMPPEARNLDDYSWRGESDRNFRNSERCYRENNGLENRGCGESNTFICETFRVGSCPYEKRRIPIGLGPQTYAVGEPTLTQCRTECDSIDGCFLTGVAESRCIMMFAVDYNNDSIIVKTCNNEANIETNTINGITSDASDPVECIHPTPVSPVPCLTVTVTDRVTERETITESYTETVYITLLSSITQTIGNIQITNTETITITETMTAEASTILSSVILVTTVTEVQSMSCNVQCAESTRSISPTTTLLPVSSVVGVTQSSPISTTGLLSSSFGGFLASDGTLRTKVCRNVVYVTPNEEETESAVQSIVKELTVEKGNLTAVIIKKISAEDQRTSSTVIGYAGIVFLILPLLLMIIVDMPTYYMAGKNLAILCRGKESP